MKMPVASLILAFCLFGCGSSTPPATTEPVTSVPVTTTPVTTTPPVTTTTPVFVPDPNAARNAAIIQTATAQAVALGLNVYAGEGHAADAMTIATKMKEIVSTTALPYLSGTQGASSSAINGFLNGQFVTLPSEAQSILSLAAVLLDTYLPAPSANALLDADQLSYVRAFFQGLNDGSAQYIANPPAATATVKAVTVREKSTAAWFNPNKK